MLINNNLFIYYIMKLFQNFFLSFHIILVVFLVISPLFVSNSFKKQYGNNISIIMFLIMSSWLLLGNCVLSSLENAEKNGSFIAFLNKILKINTDGYNDKIKFVTSIMFLATFYFYSNKNDYIKIFVLGYSYFNLVQLIE